MNGRRAALIVGLGCVLVILLLVVAVVAVPGAWFLITQVDRTASGPSPGAIATKVIQQVPIPTAAPIREEGQATAQEPAQQSPPIGENVLTSLYEQVNPGVVSIRVEVTRGPLTGEGAGSGFILDNDGYIVTNNHVVAGATRAIVVFYDGTEAEAEVIGTDGDSDLAVIKVDRLVDGAQPLPLGDSDQVVPGQWVTAIGNPFQYAGSMTLGIVSAIGRSIPSLTPQFSIPQAIQTDAAINPGNSGGPLLNLKGEVIGVNDQIRTDGSRANAGVGFAIPSNIVSLVTPSLIEKGTYTWPWLGVSGPLQGVDLPIMRANNLPTQRGAYIHEVIEDSPADRAGLRGSRNLEETIGGDVIVEVDGKPIGDFSDLLISVAFKKPGDEIQLTILRNGERRQVTAVLEPRPDNIER